MPLGQVLHKKGYEIKGTGRSWSSLSAFDQDGKETKFTDGHHFSYFEGEFLGRYGATDELQFTIGGSYRQNRADITDPNVAGQTTRLTSNGVQSTFFNIMYGFKPLGRMNYTLEGYATYMPYANTELKLNDPTTKHFVLGDDGNEYGAGLVVTYAHPSQNFFTVKGQYRRPGSSQSAEVFYTAEGALAWRYFALVAGVEGVSSLNNDPYLRLTPEALPSLTPSTAITLAPTPASTSPWVRLGGSKRVTSRSPTLVLTTRAAWSLFLWHGEWTRTLLS